MLESSSSAGPVQSLRIVCCRNAFCNESIRLIFRNVRSRSFVTDVSCGKHDEGTVSLASHTAKETSLELSWSKLTKIECGKM